MAYNIKGKVNKPKVGRNNTIFRLKEKGKTFAELKTYLVKHYNEDISERRIKEIYYTMLKKKGLLPPRNRKNK